VVTTSISTQTNLQITDNGRRFLMCNYPFAEFYNIFSIVSEYFKISKMSTIAGKSYLKISNWTENV